MGGRLLRRWINDPLLDVEEINERLEALDEIDIVDSNNVNTVISSKVNEQNNKVEFSRKKQELIKILDKFKRINPNISYD